MHIEAFKQDHLLWTLSPPQSFFHSFFGFNFFVSQFGLLALSAAVKLPSPRYSRLLSTL